MELNQLARTIFDDILAQGGRVYIVGGSVRDVILKNSGEHDVDVEVYHMTYEQLHDLLAKYGVVNTFGKMFAIMQLENLKGYDFALPRQEKKVGEKHQDFEVIINPELPLEKAVKRRDLTMNALIKMKKSLIYVVDWMILKSIRFVVWILNHLLRTLYVF